VNEIGAQVRRISKLSERVWLLELIRKEGLELDKAGYVGVYEVVMEAIAMVKSMAEEKGVKIEVDPDLKKWRAIQVDRKFFLQAMLNLVDNAVKYSHEGMKVRIDGKIDWPKCKISVINRGVELKDNYKDSIYKRGFRTPEAKMHIKDGCGIGLCIVKSFADIYGDISSKCTPVYGTYDFVTEFQLSIEGDI
jgi:K+-sensing histidine kinase KdpD